MRTFEILLLESQVLKRVVRVYIKLPKTYYTTNRTYPVLYLHDGHIGFNDYENDELDWGLFEQYMQNQNPEVILVGIANKETRIDELCPYEIKRKDKDTIGGKTDLYFDFIIKQLKPYIDVAYRTKSQPQHTGMMGISLGGVATVYAMTKYTECFTRFAFISSALAQVSERLLHEIETADLSRILKLYSDVGTNEHEKEEVRNQYVTANHEIYNALQKKLEQDVFHFRTIEGSKHEFTDWNKRIPSAIEFIFQ